MNTGIEKMLCISNNEQKATAIIKIGLKPFILKAVYNSLIPNKLNIKAVKYKKFPPANNIKSSGNNKAPPFILSSMSYLLVLKF